MKRRKKMAKRSFVRERGLISDVYRGYMGAPVHTRMPSSMLGEVMDEATRADRRREVQDSRGDQFGAGEALTEDASAETLEALLLALESGSSAAPMDLVPFADDPRVRPAVIRAADRLDYEKHLANVLHVVGILGGPGATDVLRRHLTTLLADPRTFAPDPYLNHLAGTLAITAGALLRLDPQAKDAAEAIARLMDHPNDWNSRNVVAEAKRVCGNGVRTEAVVLIEKKLLALLDAEDRHPTIFCTAVEPRLLRGREERVRQRLEELLDHEDVHVRYGAAGAIGRLSPEMMVAMRPSIEKWVVKQPIDLSLGLATLDRLVGTKVLETLVRRGLANEAPSIRHRAVGLLKQLPAAMARTLAARALRGEPDPALRKLLLGYHTARRR